MGEKFRLQMPTGEQKLKIPKIHEIYRGSRFDLQAISCPGSSPIAASNLGIDVSSSLFDSLSVKTRCT